MRAKLMTGLFATVLLGGTMFANAQTVAISQDGRPERMAAIRHMYGLNNIDMETVQRLHWANAFEIRAGEIAMRRGQSQWARDYARDMVRDHTMGQNEVRLLALDKGMELNQNLPASMMRDLERLNNVRANQFDQTYRNLMMQSHRSVSNLLERGIRHGHDEEVRSLSVKLLPRVREHHALAHVQRTVTGPLRPRNPVASRL
jgi:putative membrane protein